MPGIDKASGRVSALIVLLVLAAAALRGYLPDRERPDESSPDSPGSLILVVGLLAATLGIMALAILARLRDPRMTAGSLADLAEGAVGGGGRPRWRVLLIGLAVIIGWLLITVLLAQLAGQYGIGQHAPDAGSHTGTPAVDHPPPPGDTAPRPPRPQPGGDMFGYLAASAVVMLATIIVGILARARRRPRAVTPPVGAGDRRGLDGAPAGSDSLVRAAERGLAEVGDRGREPREAIIACYATMEHELAQVPDAAPQEYDTPTEVLTRAVDHHALHADNAAQLVKLFTEARFSPHVMTEEHRDAAVRVLRLVLAELPRSPT